MCKADSIKDLEQLEEDCKNLIASDRLSETYRFSTQTLYGELVIEQNIDESKIHDNIKQRGQIRKYGEVTKDFYN